VDIQRERLADGPWPKDPWWAGALDVPPAKFLPDRYLVAPEHNEIEIPVLASLAA
jgi:hypothetical protein